MPLTRLRQSLSGVGPPLVEWTPDTVTFTLSAGILIGVGLAGTTMPVVFAAISRRMPAEKRSMAFGVAMAISSLGQFAMMPVTLALIGGVGWAQTLMLMSAVAALMLPFAVFVRQPPRPPAAEHAPAGPSAAQAARLALRTPGFWLLSLGFFVCGFHVVFISTHLPAYLTDNGLADSVGSTALSLIGLFNIAGSLAAGWLGSRYPKPMVLAAIYALRALAFALFLLLPLSPATAFVFAAVMGFLWLSTVPLTNGVIAVMFDMKNLAMLSGFAFVLHQLGAFLGGWLGGLLYDHTGSYTAIWPVALLLSIGATVLNLYVKEQPAPCSPRTEPGTATT